MIAAKKLSYALTQKSLISGSSFITSGAKDGCVLLS